jgi:hypothetical protein
MLLPFLRRTPRASTRGLRDRFRFRPALEGLETRLVPYALTGCSWANTSVTASFMPDGTTTDNGAPSNLFASLNATAPTATWQQQYARALATWESVSPLNFHFVADNGAPSGTSGQNQGDSRFGDIRFGGYARTDGYCAYTYYPGGGTRGGDSFLGTNTTFYIGSYPDLYSVMLHETGHAVGLAHSALSTAVMYATIEGVYSGLSADDIAGVQAIYGTRQADAYQGASGNGTFATAYALAVTNSQASASNADLTAMGQSEYFRVTCPSGCVSMSVTLDAKDYSLLVPTLSVYDANQNLLGQASATTYGSVITVTLNNLTAGQSYYLRAGQATTDVFGIGTYNLTAQFSTTPNPNPTPPPPPAPPPSPSPSSSASFVKADTTTQGTWQGVYGADGYNVIGATASYPSYATVTPTGQSSWTWAASTTDVRALQQSSTSTSRIAACWYAGSSFSVDVNLTDGQQHQLALYLLDWDSRGRSERVDVLDAASGNVLNTQTVSNFSGGEYVVWAIAGHVKLKFTNLAGPNAVMSGLFFEPAGAPAPAPSPSPSPSPSSSASFVKADTTTQGTWQGVYGADGYNVIGATASYPSYATVAPSGQSSWTWAASTTDVRALQQSSTSTSRIAACWYAGSSFSVDVNLTDGLSHQVALYLLDWDHQGRSERVDVLDAASGNVLNTQTVSNFSGGEYVVFTVSGHVQFKLTNLAGPNAVLSGLFFAPPAAAATLQPSSALQTTVPPRLWFPCGCPLCTRARAMAQAAAQEAAREAANHLFAQAGRPAKAPETGDGATLLGADLTAALPAPGPGHAAPAAAAVQPAAQLPTPAQPFAAPAVSAATPPAGAPAPAAAARTHAPSSTGDDPLAPPLGW